MPFWKKLIWGGGHFLDVYYFITILILLLYYEISNVIGG